jgi:hypothetical protein
LQVGLKILLFDYHRSSAIVWVETEAWCFLQVFVQEKDDVVFCVVDKSERAYASRLKTEIAHHSLRRGKREFARCIFSTCHKHFFEAVFKIVYSEVVIAMETDKVVLRAFMITHKDILAVYAPVIVPPTFGLFYCFSFGVVNTRREYGVRQDIATLAVAVRKFP